MDAARALTIAGYLLLLITAVLVVKSCRRKFDYIGWVFVALAGLAFYGIRAVNTLAGTVDPLALNFWSTALRIFTITVAISTLWGAWWSTRRDKRGC